MSQVEWAFSLIKELVEKGVLEFCVGSGSRNAPFVEILSRQKKLKVYFFFEERSSGFFAIGRIKKTKRPVCVVTTSGTAVSNLLSSVTEACYSQLPLIVLSADRPHRFRKKACPQTIEQKNMFSPYTLKNYDLEPFKKLKIPSCFSYPLHINVSFEEPLLDDLKSLTKNLEVSKNLSRSFFKTSQAPSYFRKSHQKVKALKNPLVLLGEIPLKFQKDIENFLFQLKTFIYAEAHSGLRESHKLKPYLITSGEQFINQIPFKSVLRIGSIPFLKFWRTLKNKNVLNISHKPFSGLDFMEKQPVSFEEFFKKKNLFLKETCFSEQLRKKDDFLYEEKLKILESHPFSEQALMRTLSENIGKEDQVFLGNSLPLRYWDEFSQNHYKVSCVVSQRGVNGIDGLISTSLGLCSKEQKTWALLGDLSTLYDLSGLWAKQFVPESSYYLVIWNNFGGKIFSELYKNLAFQTRHNIHFDSWTGFWKAPYMLWNGVERLNKTDHYKVIEIRPLEESTKKVSQAVKKLY